MATYKTIQATLRTLHTDGTQPAIVKGGTPVAAAVAANAVAADAALDAAIATEVAAVVASANDADTAVDAMIVGEAAAVEATVAVLEADGASPTEAHVDDLRAAWDLLVAEHTAIATLTAQVETDIAAADTELDAVAVLTTQVVTDTVGVAAANVTLTYDTEAVVTRSRLRQVLQQMIRAIDSGYGAGLTP